MNSFFVTEGALRKALCAGVITPVLQPVVRAPDGMPEGVEVLARWYLPDGSAVSPDVFITQAARSGLEAEIASVLMRKVIPTVCRLAGVLDHTLIVGFNAGPACLDDPTFEAACATFLSECNGTGVRIAIEVTERELLMPSLSANLDRLRAMGVKIVLDDYGSGYATKDILPWMSPEVVKVDRSLTMLAGAGDPEGLLTTELETLRRTGVRVLAEGVETIQEFRWLYANEVRLFQGYLFGRPVPPEDIERAIIFDEFII